MISVFNGSHLSYHQEGHGPCPLLLFHGFGQTHEAFLTLARGVHHTHTCYLFDLYFHGESQWQHGEQPLAKDLWKTIITDFLTKNNIDKFSVGGFSLGGKLALAIVEAFPERILDVYLIAPDGIKTSFWYSLATYPYLLRKLFKSTIHHPGLFFRLAGIFNRLGLVDKGLIRFASSQMTTEEQRRRVYYAWTVFRHLHFDMQEIAQRVNENNLNVFVVVGEFDKVIRVKNMNRFMILLDKKQLITLPTGHNGLLKSKELVAILGGDAR
jgi:pimeloyl-ACP methyl ester carboxylesterase